MNYSDDKTNFKRKRRNDQTGSTGRRFNNSGNARFKRDFKRKRFSKSKSRGTGSDFDSENKNGNESEFYRNDYFFETKPSETIVLDPNPKSIFKNRTPKTRPIDEYIKKGVVVINKPSGPTSHEIAAYVKQILNVNTAGHSGSLDPVVTGVQPVMIEYATRAVGAIRLSGKEYICILRLHKPVPQSLIKKTLNEFTGSVYQMPPVTSAVKRRIRTRKVYYINVIEISGKDVLIQVGCEAGTYIRKLCHDIGLALGVGAHMQELIRSKAGPFDETHMTTLQELTDAVYFWKNEKDESLIRKIILPMESAFSHLPKITVKDSAVGALSNGAFLAQPGIVSFTTNVEKNQLVAVFTQSGEIVSLSRSNVDSKDIENLKSGIVATPIAVYMKSGEYPNIWKSKSQKENEN
ncbi:MAG: RNA-guided pseudouridylation complex pseudouridine synthase subunit Cbf5 [Methanosarcinaceae archaeon]|nr:RNA-guided pseudouridylation complex pseudouridine synthase subunit Cbf5 [Methanosarcinaceae archaeon]